MTIEIKYGHFKNQTFHEAMDKVSKHTKLDTATLYKISKVIKKLRSEYQEAQEMYTQILKKHAELKDDGEFDFEKDASGAPIPNKVVIIKGKIKDYQQAVKEFDDLTCEINLSKIPLSKLEGIGLNAEEFLSLEPILTEEESKL